MLTDHPVSLFLGVSVLNSVRGTETAHKGTANDVSAKYKVVDAGI